MTTLTDVSKAQMKAGETPAEFEARLDGLAEKRRTPIGDGLTMCWRLWGLEGGEIVKPPLFLGHGGYGSWRHWALNVLPLSEKYTVIAADFPGLGDSDHNEKLETIQQIGKAVSDGIDGILPGPRRFQYAGFSFGGIVGAQVALLQGDRMVDFLFIGSGGLGLPFEEQEGLMKVRSHLTDEERLAVHRNNLGIIMLSGPSVVDDLAVYLQDETTRRARARSGNIPKEDSLALALPDIEARIHTIWGEKDRVVGRYLEPRIDLMQRLVSGIDLHLIEGAGHWCIYERADLVNPLIGEIMGDGAEG